MSGYFGREASVVVAFWWADGRRGGVFPLAVCLVLTFFFVLNTVRADYSVTECLLAISIIMLERHRHPFLHTASQRDDTSPPARLPAPRLHPLYFAGSSGFYPQVALCFFFFVIPTISAAHSRSMCFFPRLPRLADSPTRLLHRRTAG